MTPFEGHCGASCWSLPVFYAGAMERKSPPMLLLIFLNGSSLAGGLLSSKDWCSVPIKLKASC